MIINTNNIKHVSFDLWLTLIKSHPEFKDKRNQLFKDFFDVPKSIDEVSKSIRHFDVFCNDTNQRTGLNFDTFEVYYLILDTLEMNLDGISTAKLNDFYNECENLFLEYKPVLILDDTERVLEDLKNSNISINILSNTVFIKGRTLRKLLDFYELTNYFDFQLYSDETGFSKPNPKMFDLVFEQTKHIKPIEKNEILHVGDNIIADYNGALNFGFSAQLV